jgi:N-acetylmuramoyl-L-alanine amidase
MVKIYIDLGHGGQDPGAIGNGLQEKNVVLEIGKLIKDMFSQYENVQLKFSRLTDKTLSLSQRTNEANAWGADVLLSVHINAGGGDGFESFIYNGNYYSVSEKRNAALQNTIHKNIMSKCSFFDDRGQKRANFHMLRESAMIGVLTECGFIDNRQDAAALKDRGKLMKIAAGHVEGLADFFGLKKKAAAPKPTADGKLYKVQIGAFSDKENAEQLADQAEKKGFKTYIVIE